MNTLIYNTQQTGATYTIVKVASEIDTSFHKFVRVKISDLDNFLHIQNIKIIRNYLQGFIKRRLIAYNKKHVYCQTRIKQLNILLSYLQKTENNHYRFYSIVIKWEDLLLNSLPYVEDISHEKIKSIIENCNKQIQKYDKARTFSQNPRINFPSPRLGGNQISTQ